MVACPDCGTPNRADAELCVQCWRGMSEDLAARIATPAFAAPPPPPRGVPTPRPRAVTAPETQQTIKFEPVTPRASDPGAVPYFAPVGGGVAQPAGFPLPSTPAPSSTSSGASFPYGMIVALGVVAALLAGGYLFFFGGKSGTFSPEDGAYSVELPAGWSPIEELEGTQPGLDLAVHNENNQAAIMVAHYPVPAGVNKEQMKAGMEFAQQLIPQFPGVTMSKLHESTVLMGKGVTSFEMTLSAGSGIVPGGGGGRMRMVFGVHESAPSLVMISVACADAECPRAEAALTEMAKTLEFSS